MSDENVEIVRRAYEAFQRGDFSTMLQDVSPDLVTYRAEPEGAIFRGPEGLIEAIQDWTEGFAKFDATADEFVDAGERVVVRMHQRARGQASGVDVEADFWCVHTLAAGKMTRYEIYPSKAQAMEAAGLKR